MVAKVETLAGTTIGITATAPGTYDAAGYAAVGGGYTTIGEITDVPEFGVAYNLVTHLPIASRQVQKFKGSYNNGSMTVSLARDDDDAGQVICIAALASDNEYTFNITYQAARNDYFTAKVMSFTSIGGGVDSIVMRSMQLEITRPIITTA